MPTRLSEYFVGIGAKRLSEVEVNQKKSNQHEFNGAKGFKALFGTEKKVYQTRFIYIEDNKESIVEDNGTLSWYDSRENQAHRGPEFRLYYSKNVVIESANPSDLLIVAKTATDSLLCIISANESTSEEQLLWLFGLKEVGDAFILKDFSSEIGDIGFAGRYILSSIGIEEEKKDSSFLDLILEKFGETFPSTKVFSEFSRKTMGEIDSIKEPDGALLAWMEREELLFKTLERHLVEKELKKGFGEEEKRVENFIGFSLSVHQRRKSRAGYAFENHLAHIFDENKVRYSSKPKTERKNMPDFLFPGINEYQDSKFEAALLTMLGLKTSAKERWRQVIPEADRIWPKHLITLEPAISKNQTDEMISQRVCLVLPKPIIKTYAAEQQKQIMSLADFVSLVIDKQKKSFFSERASKLK